MSTPLLSSIKQSALTRAQTQFCCFHFPNSHRCLQDSNFLHKAHGNKFLLKPKYNLGCDYPRFTDKETKAQHSKEDNETKWVYQPR